MTDWKRKKLWLEEENGQVHTQKNYCIEGYTKNNSKQRPEEKKPQNYGPLSEEWADVRYWSMLW